MQTESMVIAWVYITGGMILIGISYNVYRIFFRRY
jgi:hypothetical protein